MPGNGISPSAVAMAALGGVLAYAGFRGVNPLQALRDVATGHPPAVASNPVTASTSTSAPATAGGANGVALLAEMQRIGTGRSYSQLRRTGPNSYDCSGLVWRAGNNLGIWPKGTTAFSTATFRLHIHEFGLTDVGNGNHKVVRGDMPRAGDILLWLGHMGVATDGANFFSALSAHRPAGHQIQTIPIIDVDGEHGTHHVLRFGS